MRHRSEKRCGPHNGGKGKVLPISQFHLDANALDGHQSRCKSCLNAARRKRYDSVGPSIRDVYSATVSYAAKRGIPFELTLDDFRSIVALPCVYGGGRRPLFNIWIDRKNLSVGYTDENTVPCCYRHNKIKADLFSFESMVRIVREFGEAKECGNAVRKTTAKKIRGLP